MAPKTKTTTKFDWIPEDYATLKEKFIELRSILFDVKAELIRYINEDDEKAKRSTYFRLSKDDREFLASIDPKGQGNMTLRRHHL